MDRNRQILQEVLFFSSLIRKVKHDTNLKLSSLESGLMMARKRGVTESCRLIPLKSSFLKAEVADCRAEARISQDLFESLQ